MFKLLLIMSNLCFSGNIEMIDNSIFNFSNEFLTKAFIISFRHIDEYRREFI